MTRTIAAILAMALFIFLITSSTILTAQNETSQSNQTNITNITNETNQIRPEPECYTNEDCDDNNDLTIDYCIDGICNYKENKEIIQNKTNESALIEFNFIVEDHEGKPIDSKLHIYNESEEKWEKLWKANVEKGKYDVKVMLEKSPIKKIEIKSLEVKDAKQKIKIDEPPLEKGRKNSVQVYAIDPTELDFSKAEVTVTAKGSELWKCKTWNFEEQECKDPCNGTKCNIPKWIKIMDIIPGQEYTFTLTPEDPAYAEYNSTYGAPTCNTSESPCIANSSLLRSRDSLATAEPNQPNTIDSCTDGTSGTYQSDESLENITITDLNSSNFTIGDTVQVEAWAYCYDTSSDNINFVYTNNTSSPNWRVVGYIDPCPSTGFYKASYNFTLDNIEGYHAVRVIIEYNGNTADTCGTGSYDDNDDLVFYVQEGGDNPPTTNLVSPANNSIDGDGNINFTCNATDDLQLSNITFYWNYSGSWQANGTVSVSGTSNQTSFVRNGLNDRTILWNCLACDNASQCNFADNNWSVKVDTSGGNYDNCNSASIDTNKWNTTTTSGDENGIYATGTGYYVLDTNDSAELTLHTSGFKDNFTKFTVEAWLDEDLGNGRGWHFGIGDGPLYAQTSCRSNTGWVPNNGYFVCFYGNNGGTQIYRVDNGVETQIASNSNNVSTDGYYNYTMELNSSGIFVFINDTLWINASDTTYDKGYITISTGGGNTNRGNISVDNVWYYEDKPPTTTLNQPADNYYNDTASLVNVTFNCSATDDIQLKNISLYITNASNQSFSLNQTTNISGTSNSSQWTLELGNGNYTWNCLTYDNNSKSDWDDSNRSLKINYTAPPDNPPNVTLSYPPDNYYNDTSQYVNLTFNATVTDDFNLINCSLWHNYTGSWHNNQTQSVTGTSNTTEFNLTQLTNKTFVWNIECYDNASQNDFGDANRTVILNWTAPLNTAPYSVVINDVDGNSNNSLTNDSQPEINFTVYDAENSTLACELYVNGTGGYGSNSSVVNDTATLIEINQTLSDGAYRVYVNCSDSSLNNQSSEWYFEIDTQGPIFVTDQAINDTLVGQNEYVKLNQTITDTNNVSLARFNVSGSYQDASQNGNEWYLEWQCTVNGTYYWYGSWANDSAGNVNTTTFSTLSWTCDIDSPSITFVSPTPGNNTIINVNYVYVNITADENLDTAILEWNGTNESMSGTGTNWYKNKTSLADSLYIYRVYGNDSAGNWNVSETRYVTTDTQAPKVTLNSPNNGLLTSNTTITFNCSANDLTNLNNITLWHNASGWQANETKSVSGSNNESIFTKTFSEGTYKWSCSACDVHGYCNESVENRTFTISLDVPSIIYASPTDADNAYVSRTWTYVNVTVNDPENVSACILDWNGVNESMTMVGSGANVSCYKNKSDVEGSYNYNVYANDSIGNTGAGGQRIVTFDTTKPQVQFVNPTENSGLSINRNYIQINVTATDTNLANITIYLYNSTSLINSITTTSSPNFANFTGLSNGLYHFNSTSMDLAGNTNQTETRNVTIDAELPNVIFASPTPANNSYQNWNYVYVNVTVTDNNAVDSCILEWNNVNESMTKVGSGANVSCYKNKTGLGDSNYSFKVYANDSVNNFASTSERVVVVDTTAPIITNENATSITSSSANIVWNTDENANSSVNYGTNTGLGNIEDESSFVTSHSIILSGLTANTLYYYNVTSCDAAENCNTTGPYNFTTLTSSPGGGGGGGGGAAPPTVVCGNGICEAGESWLTCSADCTKPKVEEYEICNLTVPLNQTYVGTCGALKEKERIYFNYKGVEHYIVIESINVDNVYISIHSLPQYSTLSVNETKEFDLDDDRITDITVNLNKLNYEKQEVDITVEIIRRCNCPECSEWICVDGRQTRTCYRCSEETNFTCIEYKDERSCIRHPAISWWLLLLIVLAALLLVFLIYKMATRKTLFEKDLEIYLKRRRKLIKDIGKKKIWKRPDLRKNVEKVREEERDVILAAKHLVEDFEAAEKTIEYKEKEIEKVSGEIEKTRRKRKKRDEILKELKETYNL